MRWGVLWHIQIGYDSWGLSWYQKGLDHSWYTHVFSLCKCRFSLEINKVTLNFCEKLVVCLIFNFNNGSLSNFQLQQPGPVKCLYDWQPRLRESLVEYSLSWHFNHGIWSYKQTLHYINTCPCGCEKLHILCVSMLFCLQFNISVENQGEL